MVLQEWKVGFRRPIGFGPNHKGSTIWTPTHETGSGIPTGSNIWHQSCFPHIFLQVHVHVIRYFPICFSTTHAIEKN